MNWVQSIALEFIPLSVFDFQRPSLFLFCRKSSFFFFFPVAKLVRFSLFPFPLLCSKWPLYPLFSSFTHFAFTFSLSPLSSLPSSPTSSSFPSTLPLSALFSLILFYCSDKMELEQNKMQIIRSLVWCSLIYSEFTC